MKGRRPSLETMKKRLSGSYSGPPPICPDWLDEQAKGEWKRIAEELDREQAGLITPVDAMTLAAYCQAYSSWRAAEMKLRDEGTTFVDNHGNIRVHPLAKYALSLLAEVRRMASEFGFSPASRTRVETPVRPTGEQDDMGDFLNGV